MHAEGVIVIIITKYDGRVVISFKTNCACVFNRNAACRPQRIINRFTRARAYQSNAHIYRVCCEWYLSL